MANTLQSLSNVGQDPQMAKRIMQALIESTGSGGQPTQMPAQPQAQPPAQLMSPENLPPREQAAITQPLRGEMPLAPGDIAGLLRLAKAFKFSAKNVRGLASELETGRGGLARMADEVPGLVEASQQGIMSRVGEKFPAFRAISPTGNLRPDGIASTTLDPAIAAKIARDFPALIGLEKIIPPRPLLRRYDVPAHQVRADVPTLIKAARDQQAKTVLRGKIDTRDGSRMNIEDILDAVEDEQEVVANLSGLIPKEVKLASNTGAVNRPSRALDVIQGRFTSGADEVLQAKRGSTYFPQGDDVAAKEFDEFKDLILGLLKP